MGICDNNVMICDNNVIIGSLTRYGVRCDNMWKNVLITSTTTTSSTTTTTTTTTTITATFYSCHPLTLPLLIAS